MTKEQGAVIVEALRAKDRVCEALHGLADYLEIGAESDSSLRELLARVARDRAYEIIVAMKAVNALRDEQTS